jgi:hypothetical protein
MATVRQIYEDELSRLRTEAGYVEAPLYQPLDLKALLAGELKEPEWIVEDIWPEGRSIHIHAQRKAGKSLVMLWMAAHVAMGCDPFTRQTIRPRRTGYWDQEMSEIDVRERLLDMQIPLTETFLDNFHYYLHQPIPPLDTETGGLALLKQMNLMGEEIAVLDTMSRVTQGEENSAETYRNFYRFTGGPLKAQGKSLSRLDHEGLEAGRSRGSSAKGDDVDIVWQLKPTDDGVQFVRKAARMSWIPEIVSIAKHDDSSLSYSRANGSWPTGTAEKAAELDALNISIDLGRLKVAQALKDAGLVPGKATILGAAINYRRQRNLL